MITKVVTVKGTQTVFDLSLQLTGSIDDVLTFMDESGIDSLDSDIKGLEIKYEVTRNYAQSYYIANEIEVGTRPINYLNTNTDELLQDNGFLLFKDDGYKILL